MPGGLWRDSGAGLAYHVKITDSALSDVEAHVRFLRDVRGAPEAAERWYRGLVAAIFSLEEMPERCPVIPEADEFSIELRQLLFRSHRIIFRIDEPASAVRVLRVYHGARRELRLEGVDD